MTRLARSIPLSKVNVRLRPLNVGAAGRAAAIELVAHDRPLSLDEVESMLGSPGVGGVYADVGGKMVGFAVVDAMSEPPRLLDIAVLPEWKRKGIGRLLIRNLSLRNSLSLQVRETNLDAQLFFRSVGFIADRVDREFYGDTGEDAYHMTLDEGGSR